MTGFRKGVRVFADRRPSVRDLLASRTGSFDRVHAIVPSDAVVDEPVTATIQVWDEYERLYRPFDGRLPLSVTDPDASAPDTVTFGEDEGGVTTSETITFRTSGLHYLELTHEDSGQTFASNPVSVTEESPDHRTYWGDIHLHSHLSDGAGSIEKGMRFGRDVMDLDVVAYTDHDSMGFFIPPRLQRRRMHERYFDRMKSVTSAFHDPGSFVTLFGYEWTKQPTNGGHVNVYFDDVEGAELFDVISAETDTYEKLWDRLRRFRDEGDTDVLTIPHHTAESMYPFDFDAIDYDDDLAPLVEVYSQWGSSELAGEAGNPTPIAMGHGEVGEPGHYVQDALAMGHRVGLMASSDYHGPFPGHSLMHAKAHLPGWREWWEDGVGWGHIWRVWNEDSYPGGLCAFRADALTRDEIFGSLRERRVYGTTQPDRILLEFSVAGVSLDDAERERTIDDADGERSIEVSVAGTAPVETVTVLKNTEEWRTFDGANDPDAGLDAYTVEESLVDDTPIQGVRWDDERGTDADVYYLRVRQADGGAAWAGPAWVARPD